MRAKAEAGNMSNVERIATFCGQCGCPELWLDHDAPEERRVVITDDFGQRVELSLAQLADLDVTQTGLPAIVGVPTNLTYTVTVTNASGCTATATTTVTVNAKPSPTASNCTAAGSTATSAIAIIPPIKSPRVRPRAIRLNLKNPRRSFSS